MGDPRRSKNKWKSPRHPWKRELLEEELKLVGAYGLRNKRELRIAKTLLSKVRQQARLMLALPPEELNVRRKELISKLSRIGLLSEDASIDDVLGLRVEDLLERRLQTIVYRKGLARSIHHARQLIVHGHISINSRRVTIPGYIVSKEEEDKIHYSYDSSHISAIVNRGD
ncbi:MAG: 30S ribosomal protein S4 [Candidatus Methanomethylicia archaeon]|nr:30S ribosomal protein S4 [Candidatus Methanomethylicia archaeon]MCX8169085.1 30S ribosomal protein S4 [Candidatus Methanomethylicia archaeon]MDW7988817.1 30S ribosomal protein S4 [Nitrososphaerota archaeon]